MIKDKIIAGWKPWIGASLTPQSKNLIPDSNLQIVANLPRHKYNLQGRVGLFNAGLALTMAGI